MVCIYCSKNTEVINSRLQKKNNQVWRRRHCLNCGSIFTTLEKSDFATALSVNNKSRYRPFSRDKLFLSLYESLKHRKTALSDATALTDTVLAKLMPIVSGSIERNDLVQTTVGILRRFDKVAATYYTAYHPL